MGYDFDKLRSVYKFDTYCPCGGYYRYDFGERKPILTDPPLMPVKCQICHKKSYATEKRQDENKTAPK